jgi:hypothetical protein
LGKTIPHRKANEFVGIQGNSMQEQKHEVCAEIIKHGCHDIQLKHKVINCKVVAMIWKNLLVCLHCLKV